MCILRTFAPRRNCFLAWKMRNVFCEEFELGLCSLTHSSESHVIDGGGNGDYSNGCSILATELQQELQVRELSFITEHRTLSKCCKHSLLPCVKGWKPPSSWESR